MWRSFFLAVGIMTMIVGAEAMLIDSASVYAAAESSAEEFANPDQPPARRTKTVEPSEMFPWALLSGGAIIVVYAFTLPKRFAGHGG